VVFPDITPYVPLLGPYSFDLGSWHIGPIGVRWYALAYIAGILLGWRYAVGLARNERLWGGRAPTLTPLQIDDLVLWITLGVIVGGRLGSVLFYGTSEGGGPWEALKIWHGGMSFHGGLIGVSVALAAFAWFNKAATGRPWSDWWRFLLKLGDLTAPCVPFGLFFGRLANFINGELWGRVTDVPWAMVFCNDTIRKAGNGDCPAGTDPRHPSQLYEAALEGVALFLILRLASHRLKWLQREGALTGLFLACYAVFRMALENVRQPDKGLEHLPFGLTMGMILSTPMLLFGLWLIWRALKRPVEPAPEPQA
jgi:phosphatidylglycerol:prolipoprotein diacylglycerol transferase